MTDQKNKDTTQNDTFDCLDEKCQFKIEKSAENKVDDLKKAIQDLGYQVEETEEGEIKISNI